jgi:hypothetical protein
MRSGNTLERKENRPLWFFSTKVVDIEEAQENGAVLIACWIWSLFLLNR